MSKNNLVLTTVYVDPDIDEHLHNQASPGLSKAMLFRGYLQAGMKEARVRPDLLPPVSTDEAQPPLVLKTVYLDSEVDNKLRVEAFDSRMPKNDLVRKYVRLGMTLSGVNVAAHP